MAGQLFPTAGAPIVLSKPEMVIGRALGCDIVIPEKFVSNRHCQLKFDGNMWMVKDLGSTNGTDTTSRSAFEWAPLPPGSTLIIARRMRLVIEYVPSIERARFGDGDVAQHVAEAVESTHGYAEYGPATSRLTGRQEPLKKKESS
jgi:predicted component of type VI protein secretion system